MVINVYRSSTAPYSNTGNRFTHPITMYSAMYSAIQCIRQCIQQYNVYSARCTRLHWITVSSRILHCNSNTICRRSPVDPISLSSISAIKIYCGRGVMQFVESFWRETTATQFNLQFYSSTVLHFTLIYTLLNVMYGVKRRENISSFRNTSCNLR